MNDNRPICLCICLAACAAAYGQGNTIVQWNPPENVPASAYDIDQTNARITILTPGGYDFKFYAVDASGMPGTGIINNLEVLQTATGNCTVLIRHENGGSGALQWKAGLLTYPNGTCTITGITVNQALVRYDPPGLPPVENIFCGPINGDIDIGTFAPISPGDALARRLKAGAVVGSIFIENFRGDLDFASLTGNITTGTGRGERTPGDITSSSMPWMETAHPAASTTSR